MTSKWIFNASPLILLGKAGLLNTLSSLAECWIIPEKVAKEVSHKSSLSSIEAQLSEKSQVKHQRAEFTDPLVANWNLGAGESEVLTLAVKNPKYGAVLDDLQARKCSQVLNIPLIGSLGLVIKAKKQGLIESVKPAFDRLAAAGLYINPELIKKVLRSVGE